MLQGRSFSLKSIRNSSNVSHFSLKGLISFGSGGEGTGRAGRCPTAMRHATAAAAVLSLLACGPEDLAGFQPQPAAGVHELSHTISVRFEAGAATLKVKRVLRNDTDSVESYEHHDIALPEIAREHERRTGERVAWGERGAQLLFDCWPFEKIRGGGDGGRGSASGGIARHHHNGRG